MKALIIFTLLVSALLFSADAALIIGSHSSQPVTQDVKVERIGIQANATGYFALETDSTIIGQLMGIAWDKGNFSGVGTTTIKTVLPSAVQLDSFNLSTASGFRAEGLKLQGSTDEYIPYTLFSRIWINGTGVQNRGSATLYLIWR